MRKLRGTILCGNGEAPIREKCGCFPRQQYQSPLSERKTTGLPQRPGHRLSAAMPQMLCNPLLCPRAGPATRPLPWLPSPTGGESDVQRRSVDTRSPPGSCSSRSLAPDSALTPWAPGARLSSNDPDPQMTLAGSPCSWSILGTLPLWSKQLGVPLHCASSNPIHEKKQNKKQKTLGFQLTRAPPRPAGLPQARSPRRAGRSSWPRAGGARAPDPGARARARCHGNARSSAARWGGERGRSGRCSGRCYRKMATARPRDAE